MPLLTVVHDSDLFSNLAGTSLSTHQNANANSWVGLNDPGVVDLVIPASGRVQPSVATPAFGAYRVSHEAPTLYGQTLITKPRFLITMVLRPAIVSAAREKIMCGLNFNFQASGIYGGIVSASAALEGGDVAASVYHMTMYQHRHGGDWISFTANSPNYGARIAGGFLSGYKRFASDISGVVQMYVDEYQALLYSSVFGQDEKTWYVTYPPILREVAPSPAIPAANSLAPYSPSLLMSSDVITSSGGRVTFFEWRYLGFSPREVSPSWEPVGGGFAATANLIFYELPQSGSLIVGSVPAERGFGPIVVNIPTSYRDTHVEARTMVVDNSSGGSYIDVQVDSLIVVVPPFSERKIGVKGSLSQVTVSGGGSSARLILLSGVVI